MGNSIGQNRNGGTTSSSDRFFLSSDGNEKSDEEDICGIFRGFCPPPKRSSSRRSDNIRWMQNDRMGTPLQETPPNIRRMRIEQAAVMSSKYAGLEKETPYYPLEKTTNGSGSTASSSGNFATSGSAQPAAPQVHEGRVSFCHEIALFMFVIVFPIDRYTDTVSLFYLPSLISLVTGCGARITRKVRTG
jgi:hypothetical protein